jgi:hypothetical protein
MAQRHRVLGHYRVGEIDIPKAHRLFGLSHPTGTWVDVEHDAETARYSELVLTMQLADHSGCTTESELTRFSEIVYNLAEQMDCQLRFSQPLDDAVEKGRQLQAFCQKFDVLAIVNIMVPEGRTIAGEEIHQAALELEMYPGNMSIYHRTAGSGALAQERYSLANMFQPGTFDMKHPDKVSTRGVSLFLNVPRTSRPVEAFDEMAIVARELCARFDAQLVDQERKHLGDHGMNVIRATIARLADDMEQAKIFPGSELAERLF